MMATPKHPDPLDDLLSDALIQMAQDGLVRLEGDRVILTDKGRIAAAQAVDDSREAET